MIQEPTYQGFVCRLCAVDEFEAFDFFDHHWRPGFCDICGHPSSVMNAMECGGLKTEPIVRDPEGG